MTPKKQLVRGEIWTVDFDPSVRHEQAGKRPALIISDTLFNQGPADLVVVLPITSKNKYIPMHVRVTPPEGGLKAVSYIKCEDIRLVASERFSQRWGHVSGQTLLEVEDRVRILLQL